MNALRLNIPKYTSKDYVVLVASMLPLTVIFNVFLFGKKYFQDWKTFTLGTLVLFAITGCFFIVYGLVAIGMRSRFPAENELNKRLGITLSLFILMSAVLLSILYRVFDSFSFLDYKYSEKDFMQSFICLAVMNVFLTFLNEGISRFEQYKKNVKETEELKKEYMQSQLLGLKNQLNPHFLFNSLNTLSSLLHEDGLKAEEFLDEMSKVYRYLLKCSDEMLIPVKTELSFIESYFTLLKARYGDAIELHVEVSEAQQSLMIPPLTLQIIAESILQQNSISKNLPLKISITADEDWLQIRNNIQLRITSSDAPDKGLENISNKFLLLGQKSMTVDIIGDERIIRLPLIPNPEMSVV